MSALPETLKFAQGPHGKPFLTNPTTPCYQFNVSHSHHHALYAVAVEREVGIDIEYHRRPLELHALIRRICSPAEQMVFSTLSPPEFERCFFACWTRKEAYLKATGKGMSIPLSSITVSLPPSECTTLIHVQGADQESLYWSMDNLFIEPDYSASLVVYGSQDYSISRFEWSWDALNP
ncbi:MAG: 4'-phosphopantetheinyl transferase superfamily protein [Nitrospirales bacterium]|nr:4'-phosphopantetheinyl transferase superfamily protein [Nitrospira sp.]MDR4501725.1 4'-phosphopantetheinyl transferase superfamily protein [Nitrospirales bacterium]